MLEAEQAIIVIVDAQGKLARIVAESEACNRQIVQLVQGAALLQIPVLLTAQAPEKLGHTIPEIASLLPGQADLPRITFSVFAEPAVRAALENSQRRQVLLCGYEAHICIFQSASDLLAAGYEVHLVSDAISARQLNNKTVALGELQRQGAHLATVEMALFAFLRDAHHPAFRQVSALIKQPLAAQARSENPAQ